MEDFVVSILLLTVSFLVFSIIVSRRFSSSRSSPGSRRAYWVGLFFFYLFSAQGEAETNLVAWAMESHFSVAVMTCVYLFALPLKEINTHSTTNYEKAWECLFGFLFSGVAVVLVSVIWS